MSSASASTSSSSLSTYEVPVTLSNHVENTHYDRNHKSNQFNSHYLNDTRKCTKDSASRQSRVKVKDMSANELALYNEDKKKRNTINARARRQRYRKGDDEIQKLYNENEARIEELERQVKKLQSQLWTSSSKISVYISVYPPFSPASLFLLMLLSLVYRQLPFIISFYQISVVIFL